jgi:hypothetical protein
VVNLNFLCQGDISPTVPPVSGLVNWVLPFIQFYTAKLQLVYDLLKKHNLKPAEIAVNEFGEKSFVFKGTEGTTWQIIEKAETKNKPITKFEVVLTKD